VDLKFIYDATMAFCNRFIDRRSRTHDQMVQAARSGKQNITDGSMASGTSRKTELKLVGVARASLEELLLDFEDFLRQRRFPQWAKDFPQAQAARSLAYSRRNNRRRGEVTWTGGFVRSSTRSNSKIQIPNKSQIPNETKDPCPLIFILNAYPRFSWIWRGSFKE
jgi:hypothetical protein